MLEVCNSPPFSTKRLMKNRAGLMSGMFSGAYFEIFAAVCPNELEPAFAPITLEADRERRVARLNIPGIVESHIEPIRNPVTGEEHRARIVLPNGFEFQEAEMANSKAMV